MRSWMIAYVAGVVLFHAVGVLLPVTCSIFILLLSLVLFFAQKRARWLSFFLVSLVWSSVYSELNKRNALDAQYESVNLYAAGYVCSIPVRMRSVIKFELCNSTIQNTPNGPALAENLHLKLAWYTDIPQPLMGRNTFKVRLKRPHGMVNPQGFLYEKWLFRKGINAAGYVKQRVVEKTESIDGLQDGIADTYGCEQSNIKCNITAFRITLNNHLNRLSGELNNIPLIKALSLGFRGDIDTASWALFKNTGTQHLVAISGLHIGLVFGLSMGVFAVLWRSLKIVLPTQWVMKIAPYKGYSSVIVGLALALGYAAMAGFLVSTQRALVMLLVYYACGLSRRHIKANTRLLIAAGVVLTIDPNAVLDYGFWLSFLAVWVLFFTTVRVVNATSGKLRNGLNVTVSMQWVIFVGLMPILLVSGMGVSYTALLANFIAIPLVGMVVVPAILGGLVTLPLSATLSGYLMWLANQALEILFIFLQIFDDFTVLNIQIDSWVQIMALSLVVITIINLPLWNGLKVWLVTTIVLLLWFKPVNDISNESDIVILDVGQGLSVVATSGRNAFIYDVGPAYRNGSAAQRSLIPYLKAKGITHIEMIVISHGDDDHSGGLADIEAEFTVGKIVSGQPERLSSTQSVASCDDGLSISRLWYHAQFYYPPALSGKAESANNQSCVVRLTIGSHSILLMGDVEKAAERLLVRQYGRHLKSDGLVAGHHGSKNATSAALLNSVRPDYVVFSAGYKSRFGHPHPDALKRVADYGANSLNTADAGAIIIKENENGRWQTLSQREEINAFWLF